MPLADLILATHVLFVLFVVCGLPVIWIGAAAGWIWVRNCWFRTLHLGAILLVAGESLLGVICPLTRWEDMLRPGGPDGSSFMARWVHRLLYYSLPEWVFTVTYVLFAAAVTVTYYFIPPARRG